MGFFTENRLCSAEKKGSGPVYNFLHSVGTHVLVTHHLSFWMCQETAESIMPAHFPWHGTLQYGLHLSFILCVWGSWKKWSGKRCCGTPEPNSVSHTIPQTQPTPPLLFCPTAHSWPGMCPFFHLSKAQVCFSILNFNKRSHKCRKCNIYSTATYTFCEYTYIFPLMSYSLSYVK